MGINKVIVIVIVLLLLLLLLLHCFYFSHQQLQRQRRKRKRMFYQKLQNSIKIKFLLSYSILRALMNKQSKFCFGLIAKELRISIRSSTQVKSFGINVIN